MKTLHSQLCRFLEKRGFAYEARQKDGRPEIHETKLDYVASWGRVSVLAVTHEKKRILTVFHYPPFHIPMTRLSEASLYLHAANFNLAVGCFEFITTIGVARFKASACIGRGRLRDATTRLLLAVSLREVDRHFPILKDIVSSDDGVEATIAACYRDHAKAPAVTKRKLSYVTGSMPVEVAKRSPIVSPFSPTDRIH